MDIPYTVKPRPDTGVYNGKMGIWLFLASEVMLFGALFSTLILLYIGSLVCELLFYFRHLFQLFLLVYESLYHVDKV